MMTEYLKHRYISFDPVPEGDPYLSINSDGNTGYAIGCWSWVSLLISFIVPKEVPLDVLSSFVDDGVSLERRVSKIIQREPFIASFIILGIFVGIVTPFVGFVYFVCRICGRCRHSPVYQKRRYYFCWKRIYSFGIYLLTVLLIVGFATVMFSKEFLEASSRITESRLQNNVDDLSTFIKNTRKGLKFLVESSFDKSSKAFISDLDDVEYYLGRPIQRELVEESQLEEALSSLLDINESFRNIGGSLKSLEAARQEAAAREEEVATRLRLLKDGVDSALKKCSTMDQLLCESIDTAGLTVAASFFNISFSRFLDLLSIVEFQNLTEFALKTQNKFGSIPAVVASSSEDAREDIKKRLREFRSSISEKINGLGLESQKIEGEIVHFSDRIHFLTKRYKNWRYTFQHVELGLIAGLGLLVLVQTLATVLVFFTPSRNQTGRKHWSPQKITGLTLSRLERRSSVCLLSIFLSVALIFLTSFLLWFLSGCILLFGTQGQIFICKPLNEGPDFTVLATLLEKGGGASVTPSGIINPYFESRLETNLEIKNILNRCKDNGTVYDVFRLNQFFNLSSEPLENSNLSRSFHKMQFELNELHLVPSQSEHQIGQILKASNIDLTPIRKQLELPLLGLNMKNFLNKLQRVAGQLQSAETSSELFRLISKLRHFVAYILDPMEKRKEDLMYRASTLDYDIIPLRRNINESMTRLQTFHHYIRTLSPDIVAEKITDYSDRLMEYFRLYSHHVQKTAMNDVAKCSVIWQLFESAKCSICGGIVDPLTAIGVSSYLCLVALLPTIYLNMKLSTYYYKKKDFEDTSLANESDVLSSLISTSHSENNLWVTPGTYRNLRCPTIEAPPGGELISRRTDQGHARRTHPDRRYQQQYENENQLGARSASYYNISSSCSPRCSHHMNAMTNNLLLPHVMNCDDNHAPQPPSHQADSGPTPYSPQNPPLFRKKKVKKTRSIEEPTSQKITNYVQRSASTRSQRQYTSRSVDRRSSHDTFIMHREESPSLSVERRASNGTEIIHRPIKQNLKQFRPRLEVPDVGTMEEKNTQNERSRSSVIAMAQVTAWKEAALAGAKFVTPEFVAIQVGKSPAWVKKFWDLNPKDLASKVYLSDVLTQPSTSQYKGSLLCGNKYIQD